MIKTIFGAGGFAREIEADMGEKLNKFVDGDFFTYDPLIKMFDIFDSKKYSLIITIGDPLKRYNKMTELVSSKNYSHIINFYTHISSRALLLDRDTIRIGRGSIICAGSILTTNIKLGNHSHINLNTTIGHDCEIGSFFTSGPGVNISGNCKIGKRVYIGSNSTVKEGVTICNDVTIGMNSGVVKDILEPGTYVGCPCVKIK